MNFLMLQKFNFSMMFSENFNNFILPNKLNNTSLYLILLKSATLIEYKIDFL